MPPNSQQQSVRPDEEDGSIITVIKTLISLTIIVTSYYVTTSQLSNGPLPLSIASGSSNTLESISEQQIREIPPESQLCQVSNPFQASNQPSQDTCSSVNIPIKTNNFNTNDKINTNTNIDSNPVSKPDTSTFDSDKSEPTPNVSSNSNDNSNGNLNSNSKDKLDKLDKTSGCVNINKLCNFWWSKGACKDNAGYMSLYCAKACDTCDMQTEEFRMYATNCKDKHGDCPYWASIGECEANTGFMIEKCIKSCNFCIYSKRCQSENALTYDNHATVSITNNQFWAKMYLENIILNNFVQFKYDISFESFDPPIIVIDNFITNDSIGKHIISSFTKNLIQLEYQHNPIRGKNGTCDEECLLANHESINYILEGLTDIFGGNSSDVYTRNVGKSAQSIEEKSRPTFTKTKKTQKTQGEINGNRNRNGNESDSDINIINATCQMSDDQENGDNCKVGERQETIETEREDKKEYNFNILDNLEFLKVYKYGFGTKSHSGHDFNQDQFDMPCGPGILSFFIFLNNIDSKHGGQLSFPDLNININAKQGRLVLWPNVKLDNVFAKLQSTRYQQFPISKGFQYGIKGILHLYEYRNNYVYQCTNV